MTHLVTHHGYAQHNLLPVIHEVNLGNRDIERLSQLVLDAADDLALILEGAGLAEDQVGFEGGGVHEEVSRRVFISEYRQRHIENFLIIVLTVCEYQLAQEQPAFRN